MNQGFVQAGEALYLCITYLTTINTIKYSAWTTFFPVTLMPNLSLKIFTLAWRSQGLVFYHRAILPFFGK